MKKKEWKERMLRMFLGDIPDDSGGGVSDTEEPAGEPAEIVTVENETQNKDDYEHNGESGDQNGDGGTSDGDGVSGSGDGEESGTAECARQESGRAEESSEDSQGVGSAGGDETADEGADGSSFESNLAESVLRLEGFRAGRGIPEEEFREAIGMLIKITEKCRDGVIDVDLIDFAVKGISCDRLQAIARHEGEIAGRNAGIRSWLDSTGKSDGLPAPGGSGSPGKGTGTSIFTLAGQAR